MAVRRPPVVSTDGRSWLLFFHHSSAVQCSSIRLETETTLGASWSWESSFESGAEGPWIRDLFSTITFEALDTLYISAAGQFLPSGGMVNTSSRRIARHGWSVCHGKRISLGTDVGRHGSKVCGVTRRQSVLFDIGIIVLTLQSEGSRCMDGIIIMSTFPIMPQWHDIFSSYMLIQTFPVYHGGLSYPFFLPQLLSTHFCAHACRPA